MNFSRGGYPIDMNSNTTTPDQLTRATPEIPRLREGYREAPKREPSGRWLYGGAALLILAPVAAAVWVSWTGGPAVETPPFAVRPIEEITSGIRGNSPGSQALPALADGLSARPISSPVRRTAAWPVRRPAAPPSPRPPSVHPAAQVRPSLPATLTRNILSGASNAFHLITKLVQGPSGSSRRIAPSAAIAASATAARGTYFSSGSIAGAANGLSHGSAQAVLGGRTAAPATYRQFNATSDAPSYDAAAAPGTVDSLSLIVVSSEAASGSDGLSTSAIVGNATAAGSQASSAAPGSTGSSSSGDTGTSTGGAPSAGGTNDAEFVSQDPPAGTLAAGQTYQVTVVMLNVGQSTWTASGNFQLGYASGVDAGTWGTVPVWLDAADAVGPGQQMTFNFPITAPPTAGDYAFQWQMIQNGQTFGQATPALTLSVTGGGQ